MGQYKGNINFNVIKNIGPESKGVLPVVRRSDVLDFIATTVQREKTPGWRFAIGEREIAYFV